MSPQLRNWKPPFEIWCYTLETTFQVYLQGQDKHNNYTVEKYERATYKSHQLFIVTLNYYNMLSWLPQKVKEVWSLT